MSMFDKEMDKKELNEVLTEAMGSDNLIKQGLPMRLYTMAKRDHELNNKKDAIIKKMYENSRRKVKDVIIINDDMAIIETFEALFSKEEKPWFRVYLNGRVDSTVSGTLEGALIQLVCLKNNAEGAIGWIGKMLDIKDDI